LGSFDQLFSFLALPKKQQKTQEDFKAIFGLLAPKPLMDLHFML